MAEAEMDQPEMTGGKTQKGEVFSQGHFVWKGHKSVNIFLNFL